MVEGDIHITFLNIKVGINLNLEQYQGLIFDMDGTLVDSMPSHLEAWRVTCEYYGYPFDQDYMNSLGGVPTQQTVVLLNEKFQLSHDPKTVALKKRHFWNQMTIVPALIPVTHDIFQANLGHKPIGIGTGAERQHALELLSHHHLLDKLDALVTATDVKQGKPHPETFLTVAQTMGVEPSSCLVFEDTQIGYQAAKAAGMDCVLVKDGQIVR